MPRSAGRMTSSTIRAVECPSTTSNDAFANASTRVDVEVVRLDRGGELRSRGEDRARQVGGKVQVEAALAAVRVVVGGQERDRATEERELVDRARVVGHEDVGDEHQLVEVRVGGRVDRERGEVRRDDQRVAHERMQLEQDGVVVAQDVVHDAQVEQVVVARLADRGAAERRRVEDDPAAVREAVSRLDPREGPVAAGRVSEQVGPREPEARREQRDRLAERLRVERRDRHGGHEREAVVAVDRDHAHERLVGAELPVEDAVAELLERAGRVPHLEPQRPRARRDHVDREEVVVDDEGARGGEVVAGARGRDDRPQATRDAAAADARRGR